MRLTCPSCQSEYNVAAAAIGAKGRMVRCANCGGEWFQAPEDEAPAPVVELAPADADAGVDVEPQAEMEPVPVFVEPAAAAAGYRIVSETPVPEVRYDPTPEIERSFPADDDYVPNRRGEARDTGALAASLHEDEDMRPATGGGVASFIGGFATSAVLVGLFSAVYVAAPSIVDSIPALEPAMDGYVSVVDKGRTVLGVIVGG